MVLCFYNILRRRVHHLCPFRSLFLPFFGKYVRTGRKEGRKLDRSSKKLHAPIQLIDSVPVWLLFEVELFGAKLRRTLKKKREKFKIICGTMARPYCFRATSNSFSGRASWIVSHSFNKISTRSFRRGPVCHVLWQESGGRFIDERRHWGRSHRFQWWCWFQARRSA